MFEILRMEIPVFELPKFEFPQIDVAVWKLPKFEFPQIDVAVFELPKFEFPQIDVAVFELPKFEFPQIDVAVYEPLHLGPEFCNPLVIRPTTPNSPTSSNAPARSPASTTSCTRTKRTLAKVWRQLEVASDEEDFQFVGLLCRETLISFAQTTLEPRIHRQLNAHGVSATDVKRLLGLYLLAVNPGAPDAEYRKLVNATYDVAVKLQHRRTATRTDAQRCAIATKALIELIQGVESGSGSTYSNNIWRQN